MSRYLVLLDGSVYGPSVCDLAAWAARQSGASLDLMHILGRREAVSQDASGAIGLGARSTLMAELAELDAQRAKLAQQQGRALLDDAEQRMIAAGATIADTTLRRGDLLEEVSAKEAQIELMVVGKRGEAADFAKLHLGSNLERVIRASHKPVLVAARAFNPIAKVLLAFDGSETAMQAVDMIATSPLFAGLEVHLCQAGDVNSKAALTLTEAQAQLAEAGIEAALHEGQGAADKLIAAKVKELSIDLLVMGAYGHSRVRSFLVGSTTTEMIRSCLVPVLLVR